MNLANTSSQLLFASGFLFMGATEEQMLLLSNAGVTHVSYILILYSIAFLLFLCKSDPVSSTALRIPLTALPVVNILLHIYAVHALTDSSNETSNSYAPLNNRAHVASATHDDADAEDTGDYSYGKANGRPKANGHMNGGVNGNAGMSEVERRQIRRAEEFELDEMVSDDEAEGKGYGGKEGRLAV